MVLQATKLHVRHIPVLLIPKFSSRTRINKLELWSLYSVLSRYIVPAGVTIVSYLLCIVSCVLCVGSCVMCLLKISCFKSIDFLPSCGIVALLLLISCFLSIDFLPSWVIAALLLLISCFSSIVFLFFCLLAVLRYCCC